MQFYGLYALIRIICDFTDYFDYFVYSDYSDYIYRFELKWAFQIQNEENLTNTIHNVGDKFRPTL